MSTQARLGKTVQIVADEFISAVKNHRKIKADDLRDLFCQTLLKNADTIEQALAVPPICPHQETFVSGNKLVYSLAETCRSVALAQEIETNCQCGFSHDYLNLLYDKFQGPEFAQMVMSQACLEGNLDHLEHLKRIFSLRQNGFHLPSLCPELLCETVEHYLSGTGGTEWPPVIDWLFQQGYLQTGLIERLVSRGQLQEEQLRTLKFFLQLLNLTKQRSQDEAKEFKMLNEEVDSEVDY
jgi:hypothetical protein